MSCTCTCIIHDIVFIVSDRFAYIMSVYMSKVRAVAGRASMGST